MITRISLAGAAIVCFLALAGCPRTQTETPEVKQTETAAVGEPPTEETATLNLYETLREAAEFETFIEAIEFAGLREMFESDRVYTVFAPTDEAWAKMPGEQREWFFGDRERMAGLVRYHMSEGRVHTDDLKMIMEGHEEERNIATVHGSRAPVIVGEGGTMIVAGVRISKANHSATNGVIHHIELVMLPPVDPTTRF